MDKRIELPLCDPMYETYHHYGLTTAIIPANPTIRNWYLSNTVNLECNRKFLHGYTSPEIFVTCAGTLDNECFERINYPMRFLDGYVNYLIRNLIDQEYYVEFTGIDDYYVEGKSWYRERHFNHSGLICGYDRGTKEYLIYAYDRNWRYQKFWTPKKGFELGRKAMFKQGKFGVISGIKPKDNTINFSIDTAINRIKRYLNSNMEKYPETEDGTVDGIIVHNYIAKYLDMLYFGSIPYERIDRRVFRLIWEHKKVMLERIVLIEKSFNLENRISSEYEQIVKVANNIRMLYSSHLIKRRDSVLPIIKTKLLKVMNMEQELLNRLIQNSEVIVK